MPLGAPASNLTGPNFTPPFPAYPSGHASFGGALFQTLRRFFQADEIPFTFVSDEFNGVTRDNGGNVRPYIPRSFNTLSAAEEENGRSRIYLGIHWAFDSTEGIAQGRRIADYVFGNAFEVSAPVPIGAVSRKTHGEAGAFDVDLPLSGSPGIDPRSGGPSGSSRQFCAHDRFQRRLRRQWQRKHRELQRRWNAGDREPDRRPERRDDGHQTE
jgi:hypothetical protein